MNPLQSQLWEHFNHMAELADTLTEKTAYTNLGPADGQLYMQLCDTLSAYDRNLENSFNIPAQNSGKGQKDGPESTSD